MMWSPETERLRERYNTLYGLTQGIGVCVSIIGFAHAWGLGIGGALIVGWLLTLAAWAAWRWSWRVYRRAYQAELDACVEAAKREYQRFLR